MGDSDKNGSFLPYGLKYTGKKGCIAQALDFRISYWVESFKVEFIDKYFVQIS